MIQTLNQQQRGVVTGTGKRQLAGEMFRAVVGGGGS
jgi:hypothetical protein